MTKEEYIDKHTSNNICQWLHDYPLFDFSKYNLKKKKGFSWYAYYKTHTIAKIV